jgi:hypothetical protein
MTIIKDSDGMTPFERASLQLQKEAIEAQRANTLVLEALKPRDPATAIAAQDELLVELRKGGPQRRQWERHGVVFATDSGKDGSGELIAKEGLRCVGTWQEMSDGTVRVISFDHSLEEAKPFYKGLFSKEYAELAREAASNPLLQPDFDYREQRWVAAAIGFRLRIPLIRCVVGKSPDSIGHLVKWDDPAAPVAEAEAAQ